MTENNQLSDETKPEATGSSSTQPGSQAVDMNHTNAIVPHQISNHDKLVQTMVMVDGEWVNINDTNDQKNVHEDMHKVNRVVTEAQKDIINVQNAADSAVKSADSAINASKVNSDAIKAVNSAVVAAQSGADAAMSQANKAMSDAIARDSDINANLTSMSNAVSSQVADARSNFDSQLKSATAAVDDVKAKVATNSAAIIQNGNAIELQEQTVSSAIADLKVADGKVETVAKNASSQATVATQTASEAKTVATNAKSDATVAIQTASEASIAASDANKSIVEAKINASDAKVIAGKADSTATAASIAASGATLTATNAQSQAMKATAAAGKVSVDLEGVTKQTSEATITAGNAMSAANDAHKLASDVSTKADSNANAIAKTVTQVTTNTTNIAATQKALEAKVDQTTVDKTNQTVQKLSDQVKATADQLTSKITKADMTDYVDGKGFATETYAQGLVHQTAHDWDVNLSELTKKVNGNEATTTQNMTHLQASIDGIQTTVINNDKRTKSQFSELSDAVQTKVSQNDYESKISELAGSINLRVKSEDLLSQINLQAGNTLIQSGKIYLDAKSVVFGKDSKAFIPAALITNLTADQITTGTLDAAKFNVKNFSADSITSGTLDGIKFKTEFTNDGGISIMGDRIAWTSMTSFGEQINGWIENSTKEINWLSFRDLRLQSVSDVAVDTKGTDDVTRWSIADYDHYDQPGLMSSNTHKFIPEEHRLDESADADQSNAVLLASANTYVSVRRRTGVLAHLDSNYFNKDSIFAIQKDNKIGAYFGSGDNGNEVSITTFGDNNHITFNTGYFDVSGEVHVPDNGLTVKDLHVTHWLGVDGSKNSIVNTSQGTVAINAYETAEYYFGDIGEDQTNGDGKVWVSIDYLFGQTVNTSVSYQVFVTPYSSAHVWVSKRLENRFLVESDKPSASFAWEIKAKRKGYEHTRLKNVDNMIEKPAGVK